MRSFEWLNANPFRWLMVSLILALLLVSRLALAPAYLYYFDNINFALALENFDPSRHQPQPPGYPLFVGFTRLLYAFIPSPREVFLAAGIIGAALSLWLIWKLGREMFDDRVGLIAALLLIFNPAFWMGGLTHQVRVFLAAGATAVTLACWRAAVPNSPPRWFYAAAALLGLAGGFRPGLLPMMAPLVVLAGVHSRRRLPEWLKAALVLSAVVTGWLVITVQASGGLEQFWTTLRQYMDNEFGGSSLLWGAQTQPATRMILAAAVWNGLGALSWIWALPLAWRDTPEHDLRWKAIFLAVRFLPAFLFHSIVHVGDPDQTIITAPTICLVGAWVLSRAAGQRRLIAVTSLAVLINVAVFIRPLPGLARAASLRAVRAVDGQTQTAFTALMELRSSRPVVLISYNSLITWRHLSYYFPDVPLYVLHQDPRQTPDPASAWLLNQRSSLPPVVSDSGEIVIPPAARVAVLLAPDPTLEKLLRAWKRSGPFLYLDVKAGDSFRLGGYRFRVRDSAT